VLTYVTLVVARATYLEAVHSGIRDEARERVAIVVGGGGGGDRWTDGGGKVCRSEERGAREQKGMHDEHNTPTSL
jgi:hypothetical protein